MPQITVQDETFERLQRHAKPLVDTPDSLLNRALDALERSERSTQAKPDVEISAKDGRRIDPNSLPGLTHTKVLFASIEGRVVQRANWNSLVDEMLRLSSKRGGTLDRLRQICPANLAKGRKEDEGYRYLADINMSVQGQDANGACRTVVAAAKELGTAIEIGFMWRMKEGATHPGERARIEVPGRGRS